jgi:multisubunit Na+/H+ antiporter MnhC subunit
MMEYILARLSEASTWKGIIFLITSFGLALDPSQKEAIISFGLTLTGLINVFVEKGRPHTDEEIVGILKKEQEKVVEQKVVKNETKKKSKNSKDVVSDNFFNDV